MTARDALDFLAGGGEMGALIRAFDWSKTPLGPAARWPRSLRTLVHMLINSRHPMFLWWGPELVQLYNDGYRPSLAERHPAALGARGREFWTEIWSFIGPQIEAVMQRGESTWHEDDLVPILRNKRLEEVYWTYSYSPVLDDDGAVGGTLVTVQETTARVLTERRMGMLRALAERTAAEGRTVAEACRIALQVLAENDADIAFARLYPADAAARDDEADRWPRAAAAESGRAVLVDDLRARFGELPGGRWPEAPDKALVLPVRAGDERPFGTLVLGASPRLEFDDRYRVFFELVAGHIATAIANARAYEEQRKRAEALAEIDRAKTAFFSNVSHEFRTPLTLMLGPVEDALGDAGAPLAPAQRERLELARRSALRLQKLVNALLDFSRIEAGRAQASYEETDLAALTADLASSFRSAMERAGLAFDVDCEADEPAWLDRDMWEKVVLNLLSNAFKHTFEGGVRVALRAGADSFVLEVRDTGTGIPAGELPRIFERFRRVENARSRTHEGTGIGLALVQELVRLHGGAVAVESEEGRGSCFRVSIPKGRAHLPAERIGAERTLASTGLAAEIFVDEALRWLPERAVAAAPATGKPRVVWADDNADMREYVRGLLAPHYDVVAVGDGQAALEAIAERRPDVVLTDVMMPRVDGVELVRRLRADPSTATLPVLVVSARAGEESRIEGLEAGADEYLYKPFSARELLARVAAILRAAQLRAESERQHEVATRAERALRESERRLETLIANLPGMAYSCPTDEPWPLTFASEGVLALTGRPAGDFMSAKVNWGQFIHPPDAAAVTEEVAAALAARRPFEMIYRICHVDGTLRWMLDRGRGIYDPVSGAPVAIEGFVLDLTRQREAEEALRATDRRKDEFLATLSHELRNPLAPLRNALHLLRASAGNGSSTIHDMMERQLNHLVRLVDDLLEVSRISRGAFDLKKERVEVAEIVRNAVETSQPLISAAGHGLEISLPAEPIYVEGDPVRLAQIFANLLNNAVRYTDAGGRIRVEARRESGRVRVTVQDNGSGIAPEQMPRMFEMFTRGDRSSGRNQGGLGIGLALSRRLAEMHGGGIVARSEGVGKGSEFTVTLPLAAMQEPAATAGARSAGALPARRILVVDDNRDAADSLSMLLKFLGADVQVAHDGIEALKAYESYDPAVVLLDVGMPGMDGYEVARRIRSRDSQRRPMLVALTGWGQEKDRQTAREAGFDRHLVKPAEIGALQALLSSF